MPRCPHCLHDVDEDDLLDDDELTHAETLRKQDHLGRYMLSEEEAVRRALGHRLEIELEPFPCIRSNGIRVASVPAWMDEFALWHEAFQSLVDLGPGKLGVCLQ